MVVDGHEADPSGCGLMLSPWNWGCEKICWGCGADRPSLGWEAGDSDRFSVPRVSLPVWGCHIGLARIIFFMGNL